MPTAIGFRNYAKTGSWLAPSESSALPASNLASDICAPSLGFQSRTGLVTNVVIRVTSAVPGLPWRLFGLFRTNLTPSATINVGTWVSVGTAAPTVTWQTNVTGPAAGYGQIIAVAPT